MLNTLRNLKDNSATFFLIAALCMEVLLNLATPALEAPDEFNHFYRACQVSEGNFFPVKQNRRLGGELPAGIVNFSDYYRETVCITHYTTTHHALLGTFKIKPDAQPRIFCDFANTAYYAPVSYLPQAAALFVLRQFHASPAVLYYGGRLCVFLIWLFGMYVVIRLLPVFKWLFTALALLPMHLYLVNSFSADTVTNLLSFLFVALVLRHAFVTDVITGRHIALLALVLILLAVSKIVYIGLALLLLAIPKQKFGSMQKRIACLALLLGLAALAALFWSAAVMRFYTPYSEYSAAHAGRATISPCANYYGQKDYLLHHGFYFLRLIWNSLVYQPVTYLSGYIGVFGNQDIFLPGYVYVMSYVVLVFIALNEKNAFRFSRQQKLVIAGAAGLSFVLLLLSQHLMWDCVGSGAVKMLLGRYLIPVFPLVLMLLNQGIIKLKLNTGLLVIIFISLLSLLSCRIIYKRFFEALPSEKTEFYCDAEQKDNAGFFKTSMTQLSLGGGENRSSFEHRSGNYSLLLAPASPYGMTYKFKNLQPGDLVQLEAWQKGEGALLVVSGKQKDCGDFYYGHAFKDPQQNERGWNRIISNYACTMSCDSADLEIYVWNPTKNPVFIDDVHVTIRRFRKAD